MIMAPFTYISCLILAVVTVYCCCRLSAVQTMSTVVPVAQHAMWQLELAPRIHFPCHGIRWPWKTWILWLLMMLSVLEVRLHVQMDQPVVSWHQETMAAVHFQRYCFIVCFPFVSKLLTNSVGKAFFLCDKTKTKLKIVYDHPII